MKLMIGMCLALPLTVNAASAIDAMSTREIQNFIKELAQYVEQHHLKKDTESPQMGMVYEYMDTSRVGKLGQWIQGEALDTMHDGAWYAAALASAYRATRDSYYLNFLKRYSIPFYTNVLNQSDELFKDGLDDKKVAKPARDAFGDSHRYKGEKGFCPYFWDDGSSVSLERDFRETGQHPYECVDYDMLEGEENPQFRLNGFSLGCSNHMAQDLAVMLMQTWLITHDAELAAAAKHLQESRMMHHGNIPMVDAAAAVTNQDAELLESVPATRQWEPENHYTRILYSYENDQTLHLPGFADDQQYNYYYTIAKEGGQLNRDLAMRIIYDAYTHPMLIRYWSDNQDVSPGMNRFDLADFPAQNGKLSSYRSDKDGPMGSRMGPQNMVVCGWALQALRAYPGIWEERHHRQFAEDLLVSFVTESPNVDGIPNEAYSQEIEVEDTRLRLVSDRKSLFLLGHTPESEIEIHVYSGPDATGRRTAIHLESERNVEVRNEAEDELLVEHVINPSGGGYDFELRIPYTIVKPQKEWLNGIEHGRYSVRIDETIQNLYLMSPEEQVKDAIQSELEGGLRTWRALFHERGYIPTGIDAGPVADTQWDSLSDAGGYAHLITAASQYLLYLAGRHDWQEQAIPAVE